MDEIRDWILIVGSVLFTAVLAHAGWLAWHSRRSNLRLDIDRDIPHGEVDELDLLRAELPTGGARVVSSPAAEGGSPRQADLDLNQQVPVLMEPVARAPHVPGREAESAVADEPTAGRLHESASAHTTDPATPNTVGAETVDPEWGDFDEVVVINVIARERGFAGTEILDLVGGHGLRFGDMNIFHRYSPGKGSLDGIRFSMASAVEPGTFDLGVLEESSTAGVSFFMRLPGPDEPMSAFEEMLRVAKDLAQRLGGELRDEQRSVMTPQTIEHCRQRIHEFSRKRLMRRA